MNTNKYVILQHDQDNVRSAKANTSIRKKGSGG